MGDLRAHRDGHHCEPPGGLTGLAHDIYRTPAVGTLWQCAHCRALYQVRGGTRPPGYAVSRGWVRLGRVATWWWRSRERKGWTTIHSGPEPENPFPAPLPEQLGPPMWPARRL